MKDSIKITEPDFTNSIFLYIDQHYKQWVDFAAWHCKKAGTIPNLFPIMQEIESEILSLKTKVFARLISTSKGKFTDLDFFVLKRIKTKAYEKGITRSSGA